MDRINIAIFISEGFSVSIFAYYRLYQEVKHTVILQGVTDILLARKKNAVLILSTSEETESVFMQWIRSGKMSVENTIMPVHRLELDGMR